MSLVYEAIESLTAAKGANNKLLILREELSTLQSKALMEIVTYTYDNMRSYHVSNIIEEPCSFADSIFEAVTTKNYALTDVLKYLRYLNEKGSANKEDKRMLGEIKAGLSHENKTVMDLIIRRDLRCGLGLKSFRKVWGEEFLPDMKYALMASFDEKKVKKSINFEVGAFSQLKSDGKRSILTCRNRLFASRSRNGIPNGQVEHINDMAIQFKIDGDFDLDGELVVLDENGDILPRTTGNGIVAKVAAGSASKDELDRVRYVVWDLILHDEEPMVYEERFDMLKKELARLFLNGYPEESIILTDSKFVYSLKEAKDHYRELVKSGKEGTILKDRSSLWTCGDSSSCREVNGFKFKELLEGDFEITGWYYGKKGTKYMNAIGGLECKSSCGQIIFNVGSGLTDEVRFMSDPDKLIATIVECLYNARTMVEGRGTWSLFLPRVIEFRMDKSVADDLDKIIKAEEAYRNLEE
jgi:DNA ligase-1